MRVSLNIFRTSRLHSASREWGRGASSAPSAAAAEWPLVSPATSPPSASDVVADRAAQVIQGVGATPAAPGRESGGGGSLCERPAFTQSASHRWILPGDWVKTP